MDTFNDPRAFDPKQAKLMRDIRKKRKHISSLMKKYETDPDGNTYQRALNVQNAQQDLKVLLSKRKFE